MEAKGEMFSSVNGKMLLKLVVVIRIKMKGRVVGGYCEDGDHKQKLRKFRFVL